MSSGFPFARLKEISHFYVMSFTPYLLFILASLITSAQDIQLDNVQLYDLSGLDSVVREETTVIDVTNPKRLIWNYRKLITVFKKAGNSDVLAYASYSDNSSVKSINAIIYDVKGNEIKKYRKRDFKDVSAVSDISIYEDNRVLYLDYIPTSYPYTVLFEKEVTTESSGFIPYWLPVRNYNTSTLSSEYTIRYGLDNELSYNEMNFDGADISKTETDGSVTWTAKNLRAIRSEQYAPSITKRVPFLKAALKDFYLKGVPGVGSSWESFGSWMNTELIAGSNDVPQETINEIITLTKDLATEEEKARVVYKYVQDKVRYISIQIAIGGWKPMLASDVDRLSYGDCKALTNYTKNLLEAVGVTAYYTLVNAGEEQEDINEDLVSLQGNHAILAVDLDNNLDNLTWLECTSQTTPFGYLGDFTDDRKVLLITKDGGKIAQTKRYELSENLDYTKATWKLDANGGLTGKVFIQTTGIAYGKTYGLADLKPEDLKKYYLNTWSHLNNFRIDNISLKNDPKAIVFEQEMTLELSNFSRTIGQDLIFKPHIFNRLELPPRYDKRTSGFSILRSTKNTETHEFLIPDNYDVEALPKNIKIESPFGSYQVVYEKQDRTIFFTRTQIMLKGEHKAEDYEVYRSYQKEILKLDNQKILLQKQQ